MELFLTLVVGLFILLGTGFAFIFKNHFYSPRQSFRVFQNRIAHKCKPHAVSGPGVHVDRTLPAKQRQDIVLIFAVRNHQPQLHRHVRQVLVRLQLLRAVGNIDHPFSVRWYMREPVVPPIFGDLRLLAAVPLHAPTLHQAGVCSVIPNVLSVRWILRAVVKATLCQSLFRAAVHRDRVHVHFLPAVDVAESAASFSKTSPCMLLSGP